MGLTKYECMRERGLKQLFGAPVESTDKFNNAAKMRVCRNWREFTEWKGLRLRWAKG